MPFKKGHKHSPKPASKIDSEVKNPTRSEGFDEELVKRVPKLYQNQYRMALMGKLGPRRVIKIKCLECCGFEDTRERIPNCTVRSCPLWQYRSGKRSKKDVSV